MKKNIWLSLLLGMLMGGCLALFFLPAKYFKRMLRYRMKRLFKRLLIVLQKNIHNTAINTHNEAKIQNEKMVQQINKKAETILKAIKQQTNASTLQQKN